MTMASLESGKASESAATTLLSYLARRLDTATTALPRVEVLGVRDGAEISMPCPDAGTDPVPILLTPGSAVLGPVVGTRTTPAPCAQCLALRWQRLRIEPERDVLDSGKRMLPVAGSPYLTPFALEAISRLWTELEARGTTPDEPRPGVAPVYELNLRTLRVTRFELLMDAACPVCLPREPDTAARASPRLVSRRRSAPGSCRERSLRDYDLPELALTNPVCGMIGDRTGLDYTSPTASPSIGSFRSRAAGGLRDVVWTGQTDCFGTSRISGLFEGMERYAGWEQRRLTEVTVACLDQLGTDALDPRDCGLYADEAYASAELSPFDPSKPIPWVWGYSLRDERPVLVPQRTAYYGATGTVDNFVFECSNGCASGASLEEAILHGMLELIERDSFLLAWYGKVSLPEIDPATCRLPETQFMIDRIRLCGYDVRLFDTRVDLPVPAVIVVGVRRDGGPGTLCFAAGAGMDPDHAVHSALSEVASYVPTMPGRFTKRRDEIEAMVADYREVRQLADHAALFAAPQMAHHADFVLAGERKGSMARLYGQWERDRPRGMDLLDDLHYCRDLLTQAGFDVLVVDQTTPEQELLGLHTVRVIVPGLVPIDFGWPRQRALHLPRVRDAFRRAGWRDTDLTESELHRVPHPFP